MMSIFAASRFSARPAGLRLGRAPPWRAASLANAFGVAPYLLKLARIRSPSVGRWTLSVGRWAFALAIARLAQFPPLIFTGIALIIPRLSRFFDPCRQQLQVEKIGSLKANVKNLGKDGPLRSLKASEYIAARCLSRK